MSFERQPARLATINLRNELDRMMAKESSPKKTVTGLLAPTKMFKQKEEQPNSESQRVLNYMKRIREEMGKNGV
jgi:hypothetical protein